MMFQRQNGQVLLIVILVIITASTIGLSLASRSIVSLRNSSEEAESQEALAAAEAGVEQAIQGIDLEEGKETVSIPSNNSSYTTEVVLIDKSNFLLNAGNAIPENEGVDVWLAKHNPASGDIEFPTAISMNGAHNFLHLYWGSTGEICGTSTAPAAIQAIVVTTDKTYRYVYDSCSGIDSRQSENKLTLADSGSFPKDYDGDGQTDITFKYRTPETGAGSDLAKSIDNIVFMRITPLYQDTVIGFSACDHADTPGSCTSLPTQGYVVSSTGTSGLIKQKITVFKGYPQIFLPYISHGLFLGED